MQVDRLHAEKAGLQKEKTDLQRTVSELGSSIDKMHRDKVAMESQMEMEEEGIVNRLNRSVTNPDPPCCWAVVILLQEYCLFADQYLVYMVPLLPTSSLPPVLLSCFTCRLMHTIHGLQHTIPVNTCTDTAVMRLEVCEGTMCMQTSMGHDCCSAGSP